MSIKRIGVVAVLLTYVLAVLLWAVAVMAQPIEYPAP